MKYKNRSHAMGNILGSFQLINRAEDIKHDLTQDRGDPGPALWNRAPFRHPEVNGGSSGAFQLETSIRSASCRS